MSLRSRTCCAMALIGLIRFAAAEDGFRVGAQAALEQWNIDLGLVVLNQYDGLEPSAKPAFGALAQYLFELESESESSMFVGFEAGVAGRSLSHAQEITVAAVPVKVTGEIRSSWDALWVVGWDFGRVTAFVTGGGSLAKAELAASGAGLQGSDQNSHFGWKIAPGVEIDVGESSVLQARAIYARYQGKKYTASATQLGGGADVDVDFEPRAVGVQIAWLYKVGRLFGSR